MPQSILTSEEIDDVVAAQKRAAVSVNDRIFVEKGCKARGIAKNTTALVVAVTELGADYSHSVQVVFRMQNGASRGKTFAFYARHINRLSDSIVNLNDGNPLHKIQIRCK